MGRVIPVLAFSLTLCAVLHQTSASNPRSREPSRHGHRASNAGPLDVRLGSKIWGCIPPWRFPLISCVGFALDISSAPNPNIRATNTQIRAPMHMSLGGPCFETFIVLLLLSFRTFTSDAEVWRRESLGVREHFSTSCLRSLISCIPARGWLLAWKSLEGDLSRFALVFPELELQMRDGFLPTGHIAFCPVVVNMQGYLTCSGRVAGRATQ